MTYAAPDLMAIAMARSLKNGETVFHGLASPLPMVAIQLAQKAYGIRLKYVNITGGYRVVPDHFEISTDGDNLYQGTSSTFDLTDIFDLAARGELDTAFLSGAQVDARATLNNTCIGSFAKPKVKLPGGAGSAVLVPNARRSLIWRTKHDLRTFVEKVDFATSSGQVEKVFTPLCVFENRDGHLELAALYPGVTYEEVQQNTAFPIGDHYQDMPAPEAFELAALQQLDPENIRACEF